MVRVSGAHAVYPVVGRALEALDHRHGLIRGRGSRGRGRG